MNNETITRIAMTGVLSLTMLVPGGFGSSKLAGDEAASPMSRIVAGNSIGSFRVVRGDWEIENRVEEVGTNRWRVISKGTNISGVTLYDCTAKLTLKGPGAIFPEPRQAIGDFAPGDSLVVVWTIESDENTRTGEAFWCGWPERDPRKRDATGCN